MPTIQEEQLHRDAAGGTTEAPDAEVTSGRRARQRVDGPHPRRLRLAGRVVGAAVVVTIGVVIVVALTQPSVPPAQKAGSAAAPGARTAPSTLSHGAATAPNTGDGIASPPTNTQLAPMGSPSPGGSGGGQSQQGQPSLPNGIVGQPARVQKTGSASLSVGRGGVGRAMTALSNLAAANGGFVASSSVQSGQPPPEPLPAAGTTGADTAPTTGTITLQIAEANYETVLAALGRVGRVTSLTTQATDVSGQYADLSARITALQDSRQQYLTIMTKATSVSDILAVQSQLDQLQSQLEQLQGQQQLLDSETTYGTLALTVNEGTPVVHPAPRPGPGTGIGAAWHAAVHGFSSGVEGVIRISGPLLFAILCLALLALAMRAAWRAWARWRAA